MEVIFVIAVIVYWFTEEKEREKQMNFVDIPVEYDIQGRIETIGSQKLWSQRYPNFHSNTSIRYKKLLQEV